MQLGEDYLLAEHKLSVTAGVLFTRQAHIVERPQLVVFCMAGDHPGHVHVEAAQEAARLLEAPQLTHTHPAPCEDPRHLPLHYL
jgi:hypothetical protein